MAALNDQRGFTLVEAVTAIGILGLVMVGILMSFTTQMHANTRSEARTGAISAAQIRMEDLRRDDPASLPNVGQSAPQVHMVGNLRYEVITLYCSRPTYCDTASRHLIVEVYHQGRKVYEVETVYTQLL